MAYDRKEVVTMRSNKIPKTQRTQECPNNQAIINALYPFAPHNSNESTQQFRTKRIAEQLIQLIVDKKITHGTIVTIHDAITTYSLNHTSKQILTTVFNTFYSVTTTWQNGQSKLNITPKSDSQIDYAPLASLAKTHEIETPFKLNKKLTEAIEKKRKTATER